MKKVLLIFSFMFLALTNVINAQRIIEGEVKDEFNNPIYGVSVSVKGTSLKTITDENGKFSLELKNNGNISLFFTSMTTISTERFIPSGEDNYFIKVKLQEKTLGLPEIDIVGANPKSYRSDIANSATRLDVPVMEIPGAVGVVSRKLMEDQQIVGLSDAMKNVSGVTARPSGFNLYDVFVSRGFSLTNSRNYFRNGIRFLKFSNSPVSNLERVEMFKGPASVLYGAVEPGGVINFITKPTLPDSQYGVTLRLGNNKFYQASADFTGPVGKSKKMRYRLNAIREKAESFRDEVEKSLNHISPVIDIDLGPQTTLSIDADFFWNKSTFDPGTVAKDDKIIDNGISTFLSEPWTYGKFKDINFGYKLSHEFNSNLKGRSYFRYYTINEDRLYMQMKKLLADNKVERRLAKWDADIKYFAFLNEIIYKFNTFNIKHNLLGGVEIGKLTNKRKVSGVMYDPVDVFNPTYTSQMSDQLKLTKSTDFRSFQTTYAVYIQDQIDITKKWKFLWGARADWIDQNTDNYKKNSKSETNDFAISPRLGIVYMPIKELSTYVSYSKSYVPKSGQTREGKAFKPIESKQIELGAKASLLKERLLASVAVFDLRRQNLPTPDPIDDNYKIQIGEQYSRGIELDISGEITPSWSVAASYSYTEGEISKTNDKRFPKGNKLSNSPHNKYSLWSSYRFNSGAVKGISFGGGCFFVDKRFGDLRNSFVMDSYMTADMFISYQRSFYKVAFNVKNIFNKKYYEGANNRMVIRPGSPRYFLLSLSVIL